MQFVKLDMGKTRKCLDSIGVVFNLGGTSDRLVTDLKDLTGV